MRVSNLVLATAVAVVSFVSSAQAYIPHSTTIAGRLARTHGKGSYIIEQDVQFRTSTEPLILRERWVVTNGEDMRLTVTTPKAGNESIRFDAVYKSGKRTSPDLVGNLKTFNLGPEFIEGLLHSRSGRTFLASLVKSQIVPASIMRERPRIQKVEQAKYTPEPFVRLGRSSGAVAWVFGEPSPTEGRLKPEAWVEQDAFRLLRVRFPSETEVLSEKHASYSGGLQLPRERTVNWGPNSVSIRLVSVKSLPPQQAAQQIDASQITPALVKSARLPELAQVREFYSRFR